MKGFLRAGSYALHTCNAYSHVHLRFRKVTGLYGVKGTVALAHCAVYTGLVLAEVDFEKPQFIYYPQSRSKGAEVFTEGAVYENRGQQSKS